MLTGIFMASSQAKRMGQNKFLLPYKNKPIFQYGLEAVISSRLTNFLVVSCHDEIIRYCKSHNISFIFNDKAEEGQSASIRLGFFGSDITSDYMFFAADQPFLRPADINLLISAYENHPDKIIVPTNKNISVNPTIFPNKFRSKLLGLYGDVRGKQIIREHNKMVHYVEVKNIKLFDDIDTPEDYKNLIE